MLDIPKVKQLRWNNISYQEAWDKQLLLMKDLVRIKRIKEAELAEESIHKLIFCEHQPVFTLGKTGSIDHLLLSEQELREASIEFFKINRGGDITYHGPGQLTVYPIFDLDEFFTDLHKYVRYLEEVIIRVCSHFGLEAIRQEGFTGVWLPPNDEHKQFRKICALGVHLSRWVTMHGLAFNVNTDLSYFKKIIPCGIEEESKTVTSLEKELGRKVDLEEVISLIAKEFKELFGYEYS